ncbi:MAG: YceI family protein [Candidatus Thiodiazotropha sp. (ex Monitilora ramsayi)]|nr:YceI family protein [Candidatus Thiodiazotropha sp. (ex Monitilora ramsayi)]
MIHSIRMVVFIILSTFGAASALASDYLIDTEGSHAFIQFRISHLGYSWLTGRFNRFSGEFSYDENDPASTTIEVHIDTASIDTNHAERDKHLRDDDILDVERYPDAHFVGTTYTETGEGRARLLGDLTLHGVTRQIEIDVKPVGAGTDPWGGYRRGFEGTTSITLADFGITKFLGEAARQMEFSLGIEGIRKKSGNRPLRPGGLRIR